MKTHFSVNIKELAADLHSPVGIYLQLRDYFPELLLLESNDFSSSENSYSFICADALASLSIIDGNLQYDYADRLQSSKKLAQGADIAEALRLFSAQFVFDKELFFNGLYGHCNFDAVQYFDSPTFDKQKKEINIPDLRYSLYRFIIAIHHHTDKMILLENIPEGESSKLGTLQGLLQKPVTTAHRFSISGEELSSLSDEDFCALVSKAKMACARGDVFQLVLSRRFSQDFIGDEFQVYRALRRINPSPYLFFFDYGAYKLFGSSPEAQLIVRKQRASLMPIAGTYRRTGNPTTDAESVEALLKDPKENAEHVMLVDLARNDLNRNCNAVHVSKYKEIQHFSHVIHFVSKVEGELRKDSNSFKVFADSFPAGTLSGAPKYKALEIIAELEPHQRSFYGGAIGFFAFNGDLNQAILIRSFLSYRQKLYYQAGAGLVIDSEEAKELQEVHNKLAALKMAISLASAQSEN